MHGQRGFKEAVTQPERNSFSSVMPPHLFNVVIKKHLNVAKKRVHSAIQFPPQHYMSNILVYLAKHKM